MITITANPTIIDLTGNGMKFELNGSKHITTPGNTAVFEIEKIGTLTADSVFTLKNFDTGNDINITVKVNPNPELYEIELSQHVHLLAAQLIAIDFVNKFYIVTAYDHIIKFETREMVSYDYLFTIANLPASFEQHSLTEGIAQVYASNYSIVGKLYNADTDSLISEFALSPDTEGNASVSIGKLLADFINNDYSSAETEAIIMPFKYRIHFAERYIVSGIYNTNRAVIFEAYALAGHLNTDIFSDITDKKFLNDTIWNIPLYGSANHFLYFCNPNAENDYVVKHVYFLEDGTTSSHEFDAVTLHQYQILKLNIQQNTIPEACYKIEVSVLLASVQFSETATVLIIDTPMYFRTLSYLNKYGLYEHFYATETGSKVLQTKRYTALTAENKVLSAVEEAYNGIKVSTGPMYKADAELLQNLLISETIYETDGTNITAAIPDDGSFTIVPNDEDLFVLEFAYRYAFNL